MKLLKLLFICLISLNAFSQEVVSSQGDSYSNASGSIDFTIGELVSNTGTDGVNDITQGFHQTNWNFIGVENHNQDIEASVYPNPIGSELNVKIENIENASYMLYDASGKVVTKGNLSNSENLINVAICTPGSYSLVLLNENQKKLKTFKLVKMHQ